MIPIETQYKNHIGEFLAIVEAFKTCRPYLEDYKDKILVSTDYIYLCWFMDTKSLSFHEICWAKEVPCYHFQINYCQGKANTTTDPLSWYPQKN